MTSNCFLIAYLGIITEDYTVCSCIKWHMHRRLGDVACFVKGVLINYH